MTDLLSRPSATGSSGRSSRGAAFRLLGRLTGRLPGRRAQGPEPTSGPSGHHSQGRPLTVSAALAALLAAGITLLLCMALAVVGWFLADAGAHGQTTDALRVGAGAWLVGHGAGLTVSGVPLGIVPLALTAVMAYVVHRCGRWAAATSQPVEDDRTVATAATTFTGIYVVVAVITCVLAAQDSAGSSLGRTVIGALLVSGVVGTVGIASGAGRLRTWVEVVPGWLRSIGYGATAAFLLLVVAASVLVVGALAVGLNEAAAVMSGLRLGAGDHLMYVLATVAVAPNAVLLGAAYLLGPGFAIGTGTVVSPTVVALGPVPAFPLLAALPGDGPAPEWAVGALAVPVVVGAVGAALAQRAYRVTAYDSAALRGFGSGFVAAVLTTVAVALAGGPMGTGRMADIGAPLGEVFVAAVTAMSMGGLVAGLVTAWWQRRRNRR
jgi:hypothetical protein